MTAGWVYVLATRHPDTFKIGMTSRTPTHREIELANDRRYGAFAPYRVVWKRPVADCSAVEGTVHRMLADHRIRYRGTRELYRLDLATIQAVVDASAAARPGLASWLRVPRFRMGGLLTRAAIALALVYVALRLLLPT